MAENLPDAPDVKFDTAALTRAFEQMGNAARQAGMAVSEMGRTLADVANGVTENRDFRRALEAWREMDIQRQAEPFPRTLPGHVRLKTTDKLPPGVLAIMIGSDGKPVVLREPAPPSPKVLIELD